MNVTPEMLVAAVKKAVEAGLLPRNACREDAQSHEDLVRLVLQAALDAKTAQPELLPTGFQRTERNRNKTFSETIDPARLMPGSNLRQ